MKHTRALWATAASVAVVGSAVVPSFAADAAYPTDPGTPGTPGPACAWSAAVGPDGWNLFYPEGSANYWIQPYVVSDDTTLEIEGTFPDSRYLQMATYQQEGGWFTTDAGVDSWLTDHELVPDEGSANPFAEEGAERGGSFSLTVSTDVEPGTPNTLPMAPDAAPEGSVGYLIYRVYSPAGDDFSAIDLPEVSVVTDGVSTALPTCGPDDISDEVPDEILDLVGDGLTDTWTTEFSRQPVEGLFPNADTGYVERTYEPSGKKDEVLVVHGKAPVQTGGNTPEVWPGDGVDTRFWSICMGLTDVPYESITVEQPDGTNELGCASDDQTVVDEDGYYTYVVGTEDQRERIEAIPGATFLPLSAEQPRADHVLVLRNMLPVDGFEESVVNVPEGSDAARTAEIMGDYYPESDTCTIKQLEKKGAEACLR
ncbi:hypothetical protein ACIGB8_16130 [Promicromonospora sukumoe]|uniref:hypothetical protein n=1 Tax=Promicromonospora sukumoe TaxID=88382 RepID=UPI0037C7F4A3